MTGRPTYQRRHAAAARHARGDRRLDPVAPVVEPERAMAGRGEHLHSRGRGQPGGRRDRPGPTSRPRPRRRPATRSSAARPALSSSRTQRRVGARCRRAPRARRRRRRRGWRRRARRSRSPRRKRRVRRSTATCPPAARARARDVGLGVRLPSSSSAGRRRRRAPCRPRRWRAGTGRRPAPGGRRVAPRRAGGPSAAATTIDVSSTTTRSCGSGLARSWRNRVPGAHPSSRCSVVASVRPAACSASSSEMTGASAAGELVHGGAHRLGHARPRPCPSARRAPPGAPGPRPRRAGAPRRAGGRRCGSCRCPDRRR